jgi:hypothetical protein
MEWHDSYENSTRLRRINEVHNIGEQYRAEESNGMAWLI